MVIKQLDLSNFGKFNDKKIEFQNGINLVYGKNEQGKSTIKDFVELVFASLSGNKLLNQYDDRIKRYKPWNDQFGYSGKMLIEEENEVLIKKNFDESSKPTCYQLENDEQIMKVNQLAQLESFGLVGITEIKGYQGEELLREMISRISEAKKTNINEVSYSEIINRIDVDIQFLLEDERYIYACQETPKLELQLKNLQDSFFDVKSFIKKRTDLEREISGVNDRITALSNDKSIIIRESFNEKHNELTKYNKEIQDELKAIEELQVTTNIDNKDVAEFINIKNEIDSKKEQLLSLKKLITATKNEIYEELPDIDEVIEKELENKNTRQKVLRYIDTYKSTTKDEIYNLQQIERYKELIEKSNSQEKSINEVELSSANLVILEKDYFKYINTLEWKNHIENNKEFEGTLEEAGAQISEYQKKSTHMIPVVAIGVALLFASAILTLTSDLNIIIILFGIIGLVILGFGGYRLYTMRKLALDLQVKVDLSREKQKDNEVLVKKYNEKLNDILEKYECENQSQFYDYYNSLAPSVDKSASRLTEKLKNLEEANNKAGVKKRVIIQNIEELTKSSFDDKDFLSKIDDIENYALTKIFDEEERKERLEGLNSRIMGIIAEVKGLEEQLSLSAVVQNGMEDSISQLDNNKVLENKINANLVNLENLKNKLLNGKSEEEFLSLCENISKGNQVHETDLSFNTAFDKEIMDLKDREINSLEELNKLNSRIMSCEEKQKKYNTLTLNKAEMKEVIGKIEAEVSRLVYIKNSFIEGSEKVSDSYSKKIINRMNEILFNITGKYDDMKIADDIKVYFRELETTKWIHVNKLSVGTIDQVYFALRIGLADSIKNNINLPLILDDSFIQYDVKRLENILIELSKMKRQIIILSCHLREKEIFDRRQIDYNYIELSNG